MAEARGQGRTRLLICRVGTKVCGLPLEHVRETMRPLPLEPLGRMPNFVCGVSVIRGQPTPVVDARLLLGDAAEAAPRRYVTLRVGARSAALAVDGVLGVRGIGVDTMAQLPAVLAQGDNPHVAALGMLDSELLVVLQHSQLVPVALWQELEREGQA